eukprot:449840-Rhodomonas_salina.1
MTVNDPSAKAPSDWDEEEDGEWEAPIIANPKVCAGAGKVDGRGGQGGVKAWKGGRVRWCRGEREGREARGQRGKEAARRECGPGG